MEAHSDYHTTPEQIQQMYAALAEAERDKSHDGRACFRAVLERSVFLLLALLLCVLLVSIWVARYRGDAPTVFGYQLYAVETPSMDPTLPVGSVILSKKVTDDTRIDVDDVITFRYHGSFVTHRVVECYTDDGVLCYRTKGDNPVNSVDPWVLHPEDIEAVCIRKLW